MGDLKQALIWLAEGKKIRRNKSWHKNDFLEIRDNMIFNQDNIECTNALCGIGWEFYVEPKHECKRDGWICGFNIINNLMLTTDDFQDPNRRSTRVNFCPFCGKAEKDL